jgi:hypothetical protein
MLIGISLAYSVYLIKVRPFDLMMINRLELFNEFIVLGSLYHMLVFTEGLIGDQNFIYNIGWSMNLLLLLQFLVNMIYLTYMYSKIIYRLSKRAVVTYKAKKALKAKKEHQ